MVSDGKGEGIKKVWNDYISFNNTCGDFRAGVKLLGQFFRSEPPKQNGLDVLHDLIT
jgi:hypothetical protein